MKVLLHQLDADVAAELERAARQRQDIHVRDQYRDAIIAALNAATGDNLTSGPWEDCSYHERASNSVTAEVINPSQRAKCIIVSKTRRFTLWTDDMYDDLDGRDANDEPVQLDVGKLLDSGALVDKQTGMSVSL